MVMEARTAHSESVRSETSLLKYRRGGHLYAQGIVAQVDGVEIVGDDDFFCFFLAHDRNSFSSCTARYCS